VMWLTSLPVSLSLNGMVSIPLSFVSSIILWSFRVSFFHGVMMISSFGCSNWSSCLILASLESVVSWSMLLVHVVIRCWSSFVIRSSMLLSTHRVLIPLLCKSL